MEGTKFWTIIADFGGAVGLIIVGLTLGGYISSHFSNREKRSIAGQNKRLILDISNSRKLIKSDSVNRGNFLRTYKREIKFYSRKDGQPTISTTNSLRNCPINSTNNCWKSSIDIGPGDSVILKIKYHNDKGFDVKNVFFAMGAPYIINNNYYFISTLYTGNQIISYDTVRLYFKKNFDFEKNNVSPNGVIYWLTEDKFKLIKLNSDAVDKTYRLAIGTIHANQKGLLLVNLKFNK